MRDSFVFEDKMNTDNRQDWEIAASIQVQLAHGYAKYLELSPQRQRVYASAFGTGEDFEEWVRQHTRTALARADELVRANGPVSFAPSAVANYAEYLRARGWNGTALSAGGFRTDPTPQP